MDWLQFFSDIVRSLAWPVALLIAIVLLRKPLADLKTLLRKLRYRDFEFEFGEEVRGLKAEVAENLPPSKRDNQEKSLEERLIELAKISPRGAVHEARTEGLRQDAKSTLSGRRII